MKALAQNSWLRASLIVLALAGVAAMLWWRGPEWNLVADVFRVVEWRWVVAAILLNLASAVTRALAWQVVIDQALPDNHPPFHRTFLRLRDRAAGERRPPGPAGRVRPCRGAHAAHAGPEGATATLLGTVFAHRVFDFVPRWR